MSKLKNSFLLKFIAVILLCVSVTTLLLSAFCYSTGLVSGAFAEKFQTRNEAKEQLLEDRLRGATYELSNNISINADQTWNFPAASENIMYEVRDENGKLLFSNVDDSAVKMSNTLKTEYHYNLYEGNFYSEDENTTEYFTETIYSEPQYKDVAVPYEITVHLKSYFAAKDGFYTISKTFDFIHNSETLFVVLLIASAVLSLVLFVFLMCSAGHKTDVEGLHSSRFDKCPFELLLALFGGAGTGIVALCAWLFDAVAWDATYNAMQSYVDSYTVIKLCIAAAVASSLICVFLLTILAYTAAVRLKTKTFIKTTLTYKILFCLWKIVKFFVRGIKSFFCFIGYTASKLPLVWKTVLITAVIALVCIICFACAYDEPGFGVFGILFVMACSALLILVSIMLKTIQKGTEDIVNGNTGRKIDTKHMIGDVKRHAENINSINDGIARAVEQKMRSERFKTELITNVSHDIKTPLTSIINYVDLLEKEQIDNEKAEEYIEVLSRQSARLKKLIEDLLEASKASTGNLAVNRSKFEIGILLSQAMGEYEERFKTADLEVILNKPDEPLNIMADSRHMWRIFDNVFNNTVKYAQPRTRVYIDVKRAGKNVEVLFRNISREQLNITGEELMERFVRGDSSRNTEGSGLGLSIAKNLAELQKGCFDIQIDGDLFKVKLTLPIEN